MNNTRCLGDIASELNGISSIVSTLQLLVSPRPNAVTGDSNPSEQSIELAFFAIASALDRIADDLNDRE